MTASDAPLPALDAGDAPTIEQIKNRARAAYMAGFNDILDRIIAEFLVTSDQVSMLYDVAQFVTFLCAVKIAEVKGDQPTREALMAAYWPMQKALKDEVPGQLRALAEEAAKHL